MNSRRDVRSNWWGGAAAISAFLVIMTAMWPLMDVSPAPLTYLLSSLSLLRENNPATWWSGMLLAIASLHACDGYTRWRREEPDAAMAWALLAAVFLILSADEVGSIHERVSTFGKAVGIGKWLPLLPFAVVVLGMLCWALALLWRVESQRPRVGAIIVPFLILGVAIILDGIGVDGDNGDALQRNLEVVEEALEVLGILLLLRASMENTAGLSQHAARSQAAFAILIELRLPLLIAGLVLAPVLALITGMIDDNRGRPADWLAAVALLGAALIACRPVFTARRAMSPAAWALCALCLLASVTMTLAPTTLVDVAITHISLRAMILVAISSAICGLWVLLAKGSATHLAGAAVLILVSTALLLSSSAVLIYLLSQILALVVQFVHASADEQTAPFPRPADGAADPAR